MTDKWREIGEFALAHGRRAAAKRFGITAHAARVALDAVKAAGPAARDKLHQRTPELDRLRAKVSHLERKLRDAEQAHLSHEEVRREIFKLAEAAPDFSSEAWLAPALGDGGPGVPTFVLSDLHLGETVSSSAMNGYNSYSTPIAEQRLRRLAYGAVDLCFNHMVAPKYKALVLPFLGDMVSGEIHDELRITNDADALPTVITAVEYLGRTISYFCRFFDRILIPCVSGNHGRTTRRVEAKEFTAKNFDWLIYTLLEREIDKWRGKAEVKFLNSPDNEAMWTVYGHRFLALHGHDLGVKGGDGIIGSIGPIMRGRMKVGAQQRELGREFDTLIIGHWHQYITLRGLIVNGSVKGYDEFAAKILRAPPAPPVQALFFTHPAKGITCHWPVFAEPPARRPEAEAVTWTNA